MNYTVCNDFPIPFFNNHETPCVSLFMPTQPLVFNRKKDMLAFKNLVKKIEQSLELKYNNKDIKQLVLKLKALEDDVSLWNHTSFGLALFADVNEVMIYLINQEVKELAIVSKSFHIKPLVEYFQSIETFDILALDINAFAIYKANLHHIEQVILPSTVKTSLIDILGSDKTESYLTHGVYGGAHDGSTFHGHGGKSDDIDIDRIKFFRYVDQQVLEHVSKKSQLPLILLAQKNNQFDFKKLSKNSYLMDVSIDGSMKDFSDENVLDSIKAIQLDRFDLMMRNIINQYHTSIHHELGSDQLIIILKALLQGKVELLMIENNITIPGQIDYEKSQIIRSELIDPDTDDLLDDMIEYAIKTGTKVYMLEKEHMPSASAISAIFRFK